MKNAFGIKLDRNQFGNYDGANTHSSVSFWKQDDVGWCGRLRAGDIVITETIGSASLEACYRSLRGRAKNLARALAKLGIDVK